MPVGLIHGNLADVAALEIPELTLDLHTGCITITFLFALLERRRPVALPESQ